MLYTVKNHLRFLFHLCYFYMIADAFMPSCEDLLDKCQCHSTYTRYNNEGNIVPNSTKICLKMFKERLTWSDADSMCRKEFSYLVNSYIISSVATVLWGNDSTLYNSVWIGIKRTSSRTSESKYFRISNYPELFTENGDDNSVGWAKGEPVHDCVALDIASGNLITLPCATELAFVCQNTGFPVYPVSGTLACPRSWLFYYHSPMIREKCIRPFSFHPETSFMDQTEACSNIGGIVADTADYTNSYNYFSRLNITGFRVTDGQPCLPKYLEAVVGGSTTKINCSHIVFICEQARINISPTVRILPEISNSISSANDSFLVCDVSFYSQNITIEENQLHYIWLRNGIPTRNRGSLLQFSDIQESIKWFSVPGQYHCGIMVEGFEEVYTSLRVMYLYSEVSIYITTLEGNAREMDYKDISQKGFKLFKDFLDNFLLTKSKDIFQDLNEQEWVFQNGWLNGNKAYLKYYLYVKRSDTLISEKLNENEFYQKLKDHLNRKDISFGTDKETPIVSQLLSADTCFEEHVPISETPYHGILVWKETKTKSVSEPMCLKDWRMVTRECKPSLEEGAKWLPFNYSECTKYQPTIKDSKTQCPKGFKFLDENLCYTTFKDKNTYEAAEKICRSLSSYVMDLKAINEIRLLSKLETSSTYWISKRRSPECFVDDDYSILREDQRMPHCITVLPKGESSSYNTSSCESNKKLGIVCIHQPLLLLESFIFSRSYKKFNQQHSCYDIDMESWNKTWAEANKSCRAFPIKSTLLQSIRSINDYSMLKAMMRGLSPLSNSSWWTDLLLKEDSLKWSSLPEESVTHVDWEANTNFNMKEAGVVLIPDPSNKSNIRWSLKSFSSEAASICEIQDLEYTHPTSVHIDGTEEVDSDNEDFLIADLYCVPSGWFVSGSITWFKDSIALDSSISEKHLRLIVESSFRKLSAEKILQIQGYYWCSVDDEIPYKQIFSDKILVKIPDIHTFVLHVISELSNYASCYKALEMMISFNEELDLHLRKLFFNESMTAVKDIKCVGSALHIFYHIYISEDLGNEEELLQIFEENFDSMNGILSELSNRHHLDKENIYVSFRSTVSCSREKSYYNGQELNWPEALIGESTVPDEMCITVDGDLLKRECVGDFIVGGSWRPVEKNCYPSQPTTTRELYELSEENITEENILNSILSVELMTNTSDNLSSADVYFIASILKNAATVPVIKPEVLRSVINTVDTIINAMSTSDYKDSVSNVSNKISSAMETIISNTQTDNQVIKISRNNIAVTVIPNNVYASSFLTGGVLETWGSNVTTLFNDSNVDPDMRLDQFKNFEAAVLLPDNLLTKNQSDSVSNTAITVHKSYYKSKDAEVISPVINLAIGDAPVYKLNPPIEMVFKVPEKIKYRYTPADIHQNLLSIITYIGCFLSIFGLGSIILTFIVFRKWRSELRHKVLFSLSLSLFFFLIIFLYGIERLGSMYGCMTVAMLLHYFMLATFSWMIVEAILQYYVLVKIIGTYVPRFIQKASLFAWGFPLVIVVAVLSVDFELYRSSSKYCWVSNKVFYYTVAAPVLLMLAINFMIFGIILYSNTCGRSKKYLRSNQSDKQEMISRAKAVFSVSVLLGLSWVFGFLAAMDGAELIFQYLFTTTTTLQGFLFFVFFVLRQKKTRDLWLTFLKGPAPSASHNTGGTDEDCKDLKPRSGQNKLYKVVYRTKVT
ncbi:unnamed protein product [Larinioides sclopetarius]|uniref:Uncharacterized protein n=1 Tax=Larinioides sclopetarius TaxID=280406 RepID=A0AAV2AM68_9ARAC